MELLWGDRGCEGQCGAVCDGSAGRGQSPSLAHPGAGTPVLLEGFRCPSGLFICSGAVLRPLQAVPTAVQIKQWGWDSV